MVDKSIQLGNAASNPNKEVNATATRKYDDDEPGELEKAIEKTTAMVSSLQMQVNAMSARFRPFRGASRGFQRGGYPTRFNGPSNFVHPCHSRQTMADNEEVCKDLDSQLRIEEATSGKPFDASDAVATTWQGIAGASQDTANQQLHLSNQRSQKMTSNWKKRLTTNSAQSLQLRATQIQ